MPVWKFRSASEMPRHTGRVKKTDLLKTSELFALLNTALPPLSKRGVQKFHSIEEANENRKLLEAERAKLINRAKK